MKMTITEHRNFQKLEKQRLMTFTKCELVEELLAVYEHCRKLQNTSSNSNYEKCGCGSTTDTDVYCQKCLTKFAELIKIAERGN